MSEEVKLLVSLTYNIGTRKLEQQQKSVTKDSLHRKDSSRNGKEPDENIREEMVKIRLLSYVIA